MKHVLAATGTAAPTTRCYWVVPGALLAGAYPEDKEPELRGERAKQLWAAGIRTFVSLVEVHEHGPGHPNLARYAPKVEELAAAAGVRSMCLRFPIPDLGVTSFDAMATILDVIDLSLEAKRPVYVHCFGGVGRTGTVVACWMLRHGLATDADVLARLTELRRADAGAGHRASPENDGQRAMVRAWRGGR